MLSTCMSLQTAHFERLKNVMIIDDEAIYLRIERYLESAGYGVSAAQGSEDAAKPLNDRSCEAILV